MNPANLMIRDHPASLHLGIGSSGFVFDPVFSVGDINQQFNNFQDVFQTFRPGQNGLSGSDRIELLEANFENDEVLSQHLNRFDILLGGVALQKEDWAVSLAGRIRMGTRVEVGRGWYDNRFIQQDSIRTRNMRLLQQTQFLYEFSVGYAREFTFISGLLPRLSKLYVGIAPKFLIGGSYMNLTYDAAFTQRPDDNRTIFNRSFRYQSSGNLTETTQTFQASGNADASISNNLDSFNSNFTKPTGYGFGFDFGLTYLISLGDDLSLAHSGEQPIKKSLRLGFSITDIGFVSYSELPLTIETPSLSTDSSAFSVDVADTYYTGSTGQFVDFFNRSALVNPFDETGEVERNSYSVILPTSFNGGMLLELEKIKLAADLTLGLNNTALNTTKLVGHLGLELRPFKSLPLRAGTRLAAGYPNLWSLGTGFEARHWSFSVSAQFSAPNGNSTLNLVGGAFSALKFHF